MPNRKSTGTSFEFAETIESLSKLLEFVEEHCSTHDFVLFRGQRRDWSLLPKLGRLRCRGENCLRDVEKQMVASLKRRAVAHLEQTPKNDWDWLAIGQHHGMATRLLDWTTNPLVALWFAVEEAAQNRRNGGREDGVLWVFPPMDKDHVSDLEEIDPFRIGRTRVFVPSHVTRRIAAQHGHFTIHAMLRETSKLIPLEKNRAYRTLLMKLRIPGDSFSSLRVELDRCGINAATVYSDLAGICRDAEWQHSLLDDED